MSELRRLEPSPAFLDVKDRKAELISFLQDLQPTEISLTPLPGQLTEIARELRRFALFADRFIEAVAEQVSHCAGVELHRTDVFDQVSGALEGNLVYEIEEAASELSEDYRTGAAA